MLSRLSFKIVVLLLLMMCMSFNLHCWCFDCDVTCLCFRQPANRILHVISFCLCLLDLVCMTLTCTLSCHRPPCRCSCTSTAGTLPPFSWQASSCSSIKVVRRQTSNYSERREVSWRSSASSRQDFYCPIRLVIWFWTWRCWFSSSVWRFCVSSMVGSDAALGTFPFLMTFKGTRRNTWN